MSEQLKPCPFCGGQAILDNAGYEYFNPYCVKCITCCAESNRSGTAREAVEAWNKRANEREWISVKDRLPEKPMQCMLADCCGTVGSGWYDGDNHWSDADSIEYGDGRIIYWMPYPDQPKEYQHD